SPFLVLAASYSDPLRLCRLSTRFSSRGNSVSCSTWEANAPPRCVAWFGGSLRWQFFSKENAPRRIDPRPTLGEEIGQRTFAVRISEEVDEQEPIPDPEELGVV